MLATLRHPWFWATLGWVLVIGATVASLMPGKQLPHITSDKVMHAATYAVLALWFAGLYPKTRYVWIGALLFCMGVVIEWAQGAMNLGRQRDYHDVIANSMGIATGLALAFWGLGAWVQRVEGWVRRS